MVSKAMAIALFIAGIAVGIAVHRVIMAMVLDDDPDTKCAYCSWLHREMCRHAIRIRRH
jgi:hypothetical protein